MGLVEITKRLDVRQKTVDMWRQRERPPPMWVVGGQPAWNWPYIERWAVSGVAGDRPNGSSY